MTTKIKKKAKKLQIFQKNLQKRNLFFKEKATNFRLFQVLFFFKLFYQKKIFVLISSRKKFLLIYHKNEK